MIFGRPPSAHALASMLAALAALALGPGCSVLLKPDRDAIIEDRDGAVPRDGSMDADVDGGVDADVPPDGGPDACVARQTYEVSCTGGVDDDCNGRTDCNDFNCASSLFCCGGEGAGAPFDTGDYDGGDWATVNTTTVTSDTVRFSSAHGARVFGLCLPLAYGASVAVDLQIVAAGGGTEYASVALTPTPTTSTRTSSELAVRLFDDGTVTLERAGDVLVSLPDWAGLDPVTATVELSPGIDEAGRGVMRVTASVSGSEGDATLATELPFMPLGDLLGGLGGCTPDGLFLALEGAGNGVEVVSTPDARLFSCENPRQFQPDPVLASFGPAFPDDPDPAEPWRAGGVGEPAVANFLVGASTNRVELWVDASETERADEIFVPTELAIGGAFRSSTGTWTRRAPSGSAFVVPANAREPSLLPPSGGATDLLVAYAAESTTTEEVFDLVVRPIRIAQADAPGPVYLHLQPMADCVSLRDPSLVALDAAASPAQLLLLFTCDRDGVTPDSIGAARLSYATDSITVTATALDLVPRSSGSYDDRGVFSPEAIVSEVDGALELRVWYLARSTTGVVQLALAYGEIEAGGTDLPGLDPYSGNPVLGPTHPALGSEDCTLGCTLGAVGAMRTLPRAVGWVDPYYLLLVDRTRFTTAGVVHELIPLLQARPRGR